jgi:hypothetical protein
VNNYPISSNPYFGFTGQEADLVDLDLILLDGTALHFSSLDSPLNQHDRLRLPKSALPANRFYAWF